jgi:hypothetical protein
MLPNLISMLPVPGASEMFAGGRTTSDLSGLMSNPTLGLVNGGITTLQKVGKNALSDETQTTQADVKAMFRLMPLNNLPGITNIFNHYVQDLPTEKAEQ